MVSVDTAAFVKKHIETCTKYRVELESMKNPSELEKSENFSATEDDIMSLKDLKKELAEEKNFPRLFLGFHYCSKFTRLILIVPFLCFKV